MKCLVVIAHPNPDCLCRVLARKAVASLKAGGHEVVIEDLYAAGFSPALTANERFSYYASSFDSAEVQAWIDRLVSAEALVLVFPTWWFGFPAMLKGWFDRVWAPGVAYDHASNLGPIRPRLHNLRKMLAITTLGSPWWVDRFVLWQPVKRMLKFALLGTCAPKCKFEMLSLYRAEHLALAKIQSFSTRIERQISAWH